MFSQAQMLSSPSLTFVHSTQLKGSPFAIAFDVDGVVLRGREPIGGSPQALRRLYHDSGALRIPYLFLTNGGGVPESRRALELSELLGVHVLPSQVLQGHSLFRNLLGRYQNELIVATGKGDPATVMREYGFKKVLSLEEYTSCFKDIDPVAQFKNWTATSTFSQSSSDKTPVYGYDACADRVKAAFIVSDPVDWGRDIQVLCDILRYGGVPGQENEGQPALYFAADDLEYQAAFPIKRLGIGAFRIALESIYNSAQNSENDDLGSTQRRGSDSRHIELVNDEMRRPTRMDTDDNNDNGTTEATTYQVNEVPPTTLTDKEDTGGDKATKVRECKVKRFCHQSSYLSC